MKEWKEVALTDICTSIDYGYTASSNDVPVGPQFLRITDIATGRVDWKNVPYCEINSSDREKYKLFVGDIVIARTGASTGATYIIKQSDPEDLVFASYLIRYRINNNIAVPSFVGALLTSTIWKNYVDGIVGGSAQPGANAKVLGAFSFALPPLAEQRAIAAVLSSLDDKIDLLHRQNATLEAMAEALFRQWFVVEAKEEWEEKRLGDFFPVKTGKKDANYSVGNGEYPFFTCSKQMLFAPGYSFDGSAILLAGNGDFNVKRYSGKFEAYQRTYVLIPNDSKFYNFLYIVIKYFLTEITEGHRGSVINFITKGMIEDFTILLPNEDITTKLIQFDRLYSKFDANTTQIRTLEKLRDTLLPKLMSGEVRVDMA